MPVGTSEKQPAFIGVEGITFITWSDAAQWLDAPGATRAENIAQVDLRYQGKDLLLALVEDAAKEKVTNDKTPKQGMLKKLLQLYCAHDAKSPQKPSFPQDEKGRTVLHILCANANKDILVLLLDCLVEVGATGEYVKALVEQKDKSGATPLHYLAASDQQAAPADVKAIVDLFASKGADVGIRNNAGDTALHSAAARGKSELVTQLIEKKKDPAFVNLANGKGGTALHSAAGSAAGGKVAAELIEKHGANPALENKAGKTAVDHAAEFIKKEGRAAGTVYQNAFYESACPAQTTSSVVVQNLPMGNSFLSAAVHGLVSIASTLLFALPTQYVKWRISHGDAVQQRIQVGMIQKYTKAIRPQLQGKDITTSKKPELEELQKALPQAKERIVSLNDLATKYLKSDQADQRWEKLSETEKNNSKNYTTWKDKIGAFGASVGPAICYGGAAIGFVLMTPLNFIPIVGQVISIVVIASVVVYGTYSAYKNYHEMLGKIGEVNKKSYDEKKQYIKTKDELMEGLYAKSELQTVNVLLSRRKDIETLRSYVREETAGIFGNRSLKNAKGDEAKEALKALAEKLKIAGIDSIMPQDVGDKTALQILDILKNSNNDKIKEIPTQQETAIQAALKKIEEQRQQPESNGQAEAESLAKVKAELKAERGNNQVLSDANTQLQAEKEAQEAANKALNTQVQQTFSAELESLKKQMDELRREKTVLEAALKEKTLPSPAKNKSGDGSGANVLGFWFDATITPKGKSPLQPLPDSGQPNPPVHAGGGGTPS